MVQLLSARTLRESQEVRTATLALLKASEHVLSVAQRANDRAITHLRLRVKAWQLALDPETRNWISETKEGFASGVLAQDAVDSAEAARRLEQARRDLLA